MFQLHFHGLFMGFVDSDENTESCQSYPITIFQSLQYFILWFICVFLFCFVWNNAAFQPGFLSWKHLFWDTEKYLVTWSAGCNKTHNFKYSIPLIIYSVVYFAAIIHFSEQWGRTLSMQYIFVLFGNSVHASLIFFFLFPSPPRSPWHIPSHLHLHLHFSTHLHLSCLPPKRGPYGADKVSQGLAIMPPLLPACWLQSLGIDSVPPFPLCDTPPGIPACKTIS